METGERQGRKGAKFAKAAGTFSLGALAAPLLLHVNLHVILNNAFGSAFGVRRSVFRKVLRRLIGLSKAHHLGDELVAMYGDALQRRTPNAERRTAFSRVNVL